MALSLILNLVWVWAWEWELPLGLALALLLVRPAIAGHLRWLATALNVKECYLKERAQLQSQMAVPIHSKALCG